MDFCGLVWFNQTVLQKNIGSGASLPCNANAPCMQSSLIARFMGPIWGQQDPGGHHVGPLKFAIWDCFRAFRPTNAVYGLQVGAVKAAIVIINTFLLETMKAFILGNDKIYPNFNDFPSLGFDIYSRARLSFIANTITADNPVKPRNQGINIHGIELLAPIIIIIYCNSREVSGHMRHYSDVIMGAIASQITSLASVYSTVYSDADQRKQQSSASLVFVRGIHPNSPVTGELPAQRASNMEMWCYFTGSQIQRCLIDV